MRFDIPCVGLKTVETCARSGIAVLALEAKTTLVLEREEIEAGTKRHRVAVVATQGEGGGET
jgi:DUF1009 family protein